MFATPWDDGLEDAQLAAVNHDDAPLVILAGAGSGKTRTLTARVARLLERGVPPERILLLTFTRRAAEDMIARASTLVAREDVARRLRGGTFHAVAHQFVSAWSEPLGLGPHFSVLDPADAADVMDLLRDEHGLTGTRERFPKPATLVDVYSRCVNTRRNLAAVVAADFPWCAPHLEAIGRLCAAYVARKRAHNQLDFDDLLLYWRAALAEPEIGGQLAALFDHVLVDEYQDVNALQVDIVRALRPDGRGLTVVGDDAQAIYGFRGASAGHLFALAASLPSASVVTLTTNFRSTQPILDLANCARPSGNTEANAAPALRLRAARTGGERPLFTRCSDAAAEARLVADRILERHERGTRLRDQAVLVRAAHHSDLIELELTARRVPYRKFGGLKFLEAAHVKDFIAAARLLDNPADDLAWFRVLRLHPAVGPARARALLEALPAHTGRPEREWSAAVAAAPAKARNALAATLGGLSDARQASGAARVALLGGVVATLVAGHYHDAPARVADVDRLVTAAGDCADFAAFVAGLTLDPPASTSERAGPPHLDEDFVTISTIHSAKGLEWPVVHLPHLVDGAFPSDMALRGPEGLAEEERLFYVAVTRARDELLLSCPLRMPHHRFGADDRHSFALQSRLLTAEVCATLRIEEAPRSAPGVGRGGVAEPALAAVRAAVAEAVRLDELWR